MAQANHRITIDYASIDKVLSELELRFSGNDRSLLWKGHSETPDKQSFSRVAKFYKIDSDTISTVYLGEHSEVSQAWSLQAC